ncbi:MAG: hypothetical protein HFI89_03585 [Lachnospiraceae bacterium]|nr:hypothetical protein [Lachnospiraceae bacterium]
MAGDVGAEEVRGGKDRENFLNRHGRQGKLFSGLLNLAEPVSLWGPV